MKPFLIGIAGGTGSGKTSVAHSILERVGGERIAFLAQDSYYKNVDWQKQGDLVHHNFDHPASLDTDLLAEHVRMLKAGQAVDVPIYDFVRHVRKAEVRRVEPRPVILLEGILLFAEPNLRSELDFKVFVDTDADVRLLRRLRRDIRERGRTVEDVLRQYMESVRPMHLEFVEPSKRYADIIVPEGGENMVALGMVVARVEQLLTAAAG